MPMTIVREDDTPETLAARMGFHSGAISIDAVIVDAFASQGVDAATLRAAIVSHRPDFSRRKAPIEVAGVRGLELYGNLEGRSFRLDRLICGEVTYFSTKDDEIAHAADYGQVGDASDPHPELAAGRRMRDLLQGAPFRSRRSPRIASAEHARGEPLRLNVERVSVEI
jgi:hypothetical protein